MVKRKARLNEEKESVHVCAPLGLVSSLNRRAQSWSYELVAEEWSKLL